MTSKAVKWKGGIEAGAIRLFLLVFHRFLCKASHRRRIWLGSAVIIVKDRRVSMELIVVLAVLVVTFYLSTQNYWWPSTANGAGWFACKRFDCSISRWFWIVHRYPESWWIGHYVNLISCLASAAEDCVSWISRSFASIVSAIPIRASPVPRSLSAAFVTTLDSSRCFFQERCMELSLDNPF